MAHPSTTTTAEIVGLSSATHRVRVGNCKFSTPEEARFTNGNDRRKPCRRKVARIISTDGFIPSNHAGGSNATERARTSPHMPINKTRVDHRAVLKENIVVPSSVVSGNVITPQTFHAEIQRRKVTVLSRHENTTIPATVSSRWGGWRLWGCR